MASEIANPEHYASYMPGVSTMTAIRTAMTPEMFYGFCKGNAMKYLMRAERKGVLKSDLEKARVYANWMEEAYDWWQESLGR